jgi:hypothetical protein
LIGVDGYLGFLALLAFLLFGPAPGYHQVILDIFIICRYCGYDSRKTFGSQQFSRDF